jgi:two-component system chemotaxis response regulator CheY
MAKVLIVDDAKIMQMSISKLMNELGHDVVSLAGSGYQGVAQYKLHKPDFVTMDITMPGEQGVEDGIEAVQHIIKFDKDAKIIMITSHGEQDKVIQAIQSGASNYMLKPLQKPKLQEIISKLGF